MTAAYGRAVSEAGRRGSGGLVVRVLLAWALGAFLIAVGVAAVLLPVRTGSKDCGGTPLEIAGRSIPFGHFDLNESKDCRDGSVGSIAVGASTVAFGLVSAVASTVIVRKIDL